MKEILHHLILDSYSITVWSQEKPVNWSSAPRNVHFKSSLTQYLISAWGDNSLTTTLGENKLFVNNNDDCYSFPVKDQRMCKMCERSLHSTHEEADSTMVFHLDSVINPANVVIRTSDTDAFVIALGCMVSVSSDIKVAFVFSLVNWNYFRKL